MSTIKACIERFRYSQPSDPSARPKVNEKFWWISSDTSNSNENAPIINESETSRIPVSGNNGEFELANLTITNSSTESKENPIIVNENKNLVTEDTYSKTLYDDESVSKEQVSSPKNADLHLPNVNCMKPLNTIESPARSNYDLDEYADNLLERCNRLLQSYKLSPNSKVSDPSVPNSNITMTNETASYDMIDKKSNLKSRTLQSSNTAAVKSCSSSTDSSSIGNENDSDSDSSIDEEFLLSLMKNQSKGNNLTKKKRTKLSKVLKLKKSIKNVLQETSKSPTTSTTTTTTTTNIIKQSSEIINDSLNQKPSTYQKDQSCDTTDLHPPPLSPSSSSSSHPNGMKTQGIQINNNNELHKSDTINISKYQSEHMLEEIEEQPSVFLYLSESSSENGDHNSYIEDEYDDISSQQIYIENNSLHTHNIIKPINTQDVHVQDSNSIYVQSLEKHTNSKTMEGAKDHVDKHISSTHPIRMDNISNNSTSKLRIVEGDGTTNTQENIHINTINKDHFDVSLTQLEYSPKLSDEMVSPYLYDPIVSDLWKKLQVVRHKMSMIQR